MRIFGLRIPYAALLYIPIIMKFLGAMSNFIVLAFNNGQMPVLMAGGCLNFDGGDDIVHTCMSHVSHLKFFSDWMHLRGEGYCSPGDFLVWGGRYIQTPFLSAWIALFIRDYND